MNGHIKQRVSSRLFSLSQKPSLSAFKELTAQTTHASTYPLANSLASNIPVYDLSGYDVADAATISRLSDEWNHILLSGPGVYILRNFLPDIPLIDTVNEVFESIIDAERATARGDHFAAVGSNSRIWNSYQKHAEKDPALCPVVVCGLQRRSRVDIFAQIGSLSFHI